MLDRLKSLLPHELRQSMKRRLFDVKDMPSRLENLRQSGFQPTGAIDGGAYEGDWTKAFAKVWPKVPVLMVEPQPSCRSVLEHLAAALPGSKLADCALGASCSRARFLLGDSNSQLAGEGVAGTSSSIEVTVETIESLLSANQAFRPNLLKLDLQGHELEAIRGAGERILDFEVLILEISIIPINDTPVFHEVDGLLEGLGFRVYDLIPQYYRPLDGALWQIDAFYVRHDSALIASRAWQ
jgi:FkbM family methyltransferase